MPHRLRRIAACCFALVASCVGEGAVEPIPAPFHPPQEERTSLARPAVLPTRPTPARPPPPLSGGTLLALRDDLTLVASDPDHDALWIARHREDAPARRVALRAGDEPGRLVEDAAGRVHVVLRRGGAVATVDPARGVVTARREVCPAPRGIAWDATRAQLYVACEGGEFVVLPAEGSATARHALVDDLRDVLVVEGAVYVSRFRKGTVHVVDPARGTTTPMPTPSMAFNATPSTAWRLADAGGAVAMLSQAVQPIPLRVGAPGVPTPPSNSAYGTLGSVRLPVTPTVHVQNTSSRGMELAVLLPDGGLTIDLAGQRDEGGRRIAIASPGWAFGQGIAQVREWTITPNQPVVSLASRGRPVDVPGQAVAVAYTPAGWLAVQTRDRKSVV